MRVYYNEFDPFAADWLWELMKEGAIAKGEIDRRSIADVEGWELVDYDQCHFFAGIGGWAYALELAAWRGPIWTGSCPCQPFSAAGKRRGVEDERHLWPVWFDLIAECRPDVVVGEQVEAAIRMGWLDGIRADLEGEGYALGAAVLGAHSVGAPHIRQRLYWLADADGGLAGHGHLQPSGQHGQQPQDGDAGRRLAHAYGQGQSGLAVHGEVAGQRGERARGMEHAASDGREQRRAEPGGRGAASGCGKGFWSAAEWLPCSDGKSRRVEPGIQPLAHGVPNRVGTLRGAGNAIVPQVAAEFLMSYMEANGQS